MAKQEVGLKIDVDVSSVGNMKQQLRAATNELVAMNEKFGSASKEAVAAAKRVAGLKDAIGDAKALADTFNPDKKFVALGGAVQGAVAGFSALQGAMGLFGSESKDVEKLLLKVQSAMALQQGISGVAGAMDSMKLLAGTIKTQVVTAFSTLRGAIMATGIGALGIAVALVAANFDEFKKAIFRLVPGLESISKFVGGLVQKFTDLVGITSQAERTQEALTKTNKKANDTIDAQIKILEAQGGKEAEIYALKKQRAENDLNVLRGALSTKKKLSDDELKQFRDLKNEQQVLDIEESNRKKKLAEDEAKNQKDLNDKLIKERQDAEKQYDDFIKSQNEKRLLSTMSQNEKELYELRKKYQAQYEIAKKYGFDTKQLNELQFKEGLDLVNKSTAEDTKIVIDANAKKLGDFTAMVPKMATMQTTITTNQQTESNIRKGIDEQEVAAKQQMADQTAGILNGLSNVLGAQTKAGKAAAIAAIVIEQAASISRVISNTAAANAKAVAASPLTGGMPFVALNTVSAAVSIASSIANARKSIQQINSNNQNVSGGGGGGISTSAPVAPALAPQVEATQVNTAAVNQMGNRAARAYVLNSDIQNEQQRNAYIDRNASIGNP
jgi:hypothetical protein